MWWRWRENNRNVVVVAVKEENNGNVVAVVEENNRIVAAVVVKEHNRNPVVVVEENCHTGDFWSILEPPLQFWSQQRQGAIGLVGRNRLDPGHFFLQAWLLI